MSYKDRAIEKINRGRSGENKGIPIKFNKLKQYLPNIQQSTTYLIMAEAKVGKSAFSSELFVYGVYDYIKSLPKDSDIVIDVDLWSFEISAENFIIKGIARKIWLDYGILVDVNTILSKGDKHCSDELYELVLKAVEYFDDFDKYITIHDAPDNPTGIYKYLVSKAEKHGTIHKKNIQQDPNLQPIMRFDYYEPFNKNRYHINIIDHIGLVLQESGKSVKESIDELSKYLVRCRNNFADTNVIVQQLTFDVGNDERVKSNRVTPTLRDAGDSKYTIRDCDVVLALFSPSRYYLNSFHGYDISKLGDSFRSCEILVNRDGEPNINFGFNFIGPIGAFRELPLAKDMTSDIYHLASNYINTNTKYKKNDKGIWQ